MASQAWAMAMAAFCCVGGRHRLPQARVDDAALAALLRRVGRGAARDLLGGRVTLLQRVGRAPVLPLRLPVRPRVVPGIVPGIVWRVLCRGNGVPGLLFERDHACVVSLTGRDIALFAITSPEKFRNSHFCFRHIIISWTYKIALSSLYEMR
jgi:hypothetical protein